MGGWESILLYSKRNASSFLNDKSGNAGYYKLEDDKLVAEFYSDGTFLYYYFNNNDNELVEIEMKGRKPNRRKQKGLYTDPQRTFISIENQNWLIQQVFGCHFGNT